MADWVNTKLLLINSFKYVETVNNNVYLHGLITWHLYKLSTWGSQKLFPGFRYLHISVLLQIIEKKTKKQRLNSKVYLVNANVFCHKNSIRLYKHICIVKLKGVGAGGNLLTNTIQFNLHFFREVTALCFTNQTLKTIQILRCVIPVAYRINQTEMCAHISSNTTTY